MRRIITCTSNMTRTRRAAVLAALLLVAAGCDKEGPDGAPEAVASASLAEDAQDQRIDPEEGALAESRILARDDIQIGGRSACALTVQYAGDIEQPATFAEGCEALTVRFVEQQDLAAIGQAKKLSDAEREVIAGSPGRKVLYIEGTNTSAIFMPNEADFLEKHDLAD